MTTISPRRPRPAHVALVVFAALACGGKEKTPPPAGSQLTPAAPIQRTEPPLPAPGQGGVFAHHDGLVMEAGVDLNVELVASPELVQVYLYDAAGAPLAAGDATGKLDHDGTVLTLAVAADGGSLEAKGTFPPSFTATITIDRAGKPYTTTMRWASAGEPTVKQ